MVREEEEDDDDDEEEEEFEDEERGMLSFVFSFISSTVSGNLIFLLQFQHFSRSAGNHVLYPIFN